jgi:hypothetical protein
LSCSPLFIILREAEAKRFICDKSYSFILEEIIDRQYSSSCLRLGVASMV